MHELTALQAYREHEWEPLCFLARRLGSTHLASDIAHDLYLKLLGAEDHPDIRDRKAYLNLQQMPDWAQVNLGVRYAFEGINKKPIIIRANVNNVFDANYWYSTSFGQMSLSAPRTFLLSTTFNF